MGTRFCIWLIVILVVVNVVESFRRVSFPGQDTGRTCRTKAGQRGRCETFLRCPAAIADIRKGIYPTICSFGSGGIRDIRVCCVESGGPTPTKDAFAKFSDVCGRVSRVFDDSRRFATTTPSPIVNPGPLVVHQANLTIIPTFKPGLLATTPRTRFPLDFTSPRTRFPFELATPKFGVLKPEFEELRRPHLALDRAPLGLRVRKKRAGKESQLPSLADFASLLPENKLVPNKVKRPSEFGQYVTPPKTGIVGGINALRNAWPWMTLLGRRRGSQIEWFCGGVLITDQHILTAAHCFSTISKPDVVRLGEHDLSQTTESPHIDVSASTVYRHRSFSSPAVHDDIAIVKLTRPVEFSSYVRPICMPASDFTPSSVGVRGTITGWGTTSFGGRSSDILQQVSVPIVGTGTCDAAYKRSPVYRRSFPQGFPKNLFCASEEQGGKDACQGDSGGPYMVVDGGRYRVTGIVSSGLGCGSKTYPGLYTWVYPYLQWMQETVAK